MCKKIQFSYSNKKNKKNLPTVGGGDDPSTPSPRLVASLPRFTPPPPNALTHGTPLVMPLRYKIFLTDHNDITFDPNFNPLALCLMELSMCHNSVKL